MPFAWEPLPSTPTLKTSHCWKCGIAYGMPASYLAARKIDGEPVFCPNGHRNIIGRAAREKVADDRLREAHRREQQEARDADSGALVIRPAAADGRQRCPCCDRSYRRPAMLRHHLEVVHGVGREAANDALARGLGTRA